MGNIVFGKTEDESNGDLKKMENEDKMKAIVYTKYGPPDVLELKEVIKPTPKNKEVLIRIHATTVNFGDILARNFTYRKFAMPALFYPMTKIMFGMRRPKKTILGSEFSGEIESVGKDVTLFSKGDQVFGYTGVSLGCYAEYKCMPENRLTLKPTNMTHAEAATVPYGGVIALAILRKMNIQPGQKILINGASGGIGSSAVQIAKFHFGAEVTGVCGTPRLEFVKSLGADKVIDYTKEDFTKNGETYDFIFDILGKSSFGRVKRSLKKNGRYYLASFGMRKVIQMLSTKLIGKKKVICAMVFEEDLDSIKELVEAGKIKAVIDKRFPLEQATEAHQYVEEGLKKGQIVLTLDNN